MPSLFCIHCLTPHCVHDDFCAHCGAPVGDLANYMPLVCYVSRGYVLHIGANDNFKRTPGSIVFLFLAPFRGGIFFVPFYWLRILINLGRPKESRPPRDPPNSHTHTCAERKGLILSPTTVQYSVSLMSARVFAD
jgi:hypothetical protein